MKLNNRYQTAEIISLQTELDCSLELAERVYTARLLGAENSLVLHGGGNVSMKSEVLNLFGESRKAIYVKASGHDLKNLDLGGLTSLDLEDLFELLALEKMDDAMMAAELNRRQFDVNAKTPSIETLVHAVIPAKFVDHSHADAILTLTSHAEGKQWASDLFGAEVAILDYEKAGFELALSTQRILQEQPEAKAILLLKHGLFTWGETAEESYTRMLDLVNRADDKVAELQACKLKGAEKVDLEVAKASYQTLAPMLRGMISERAGKKMTLKLIQDPEVLELLSASNAKELTLSPTLTPDHLIRTKALPMFLEVNASIAEMDAAFTAYAESYAEYVINQQGELGEIDALPRMILVPSIGAIAVGEDVKAAEVTRDILRQTLHAKRDMALMGVNFEAMPDPDLMAMEYRPMQLAKLYHKKVKPLTGHIALITGTAGAIGSGILHELLALGSQVVVTDLAGARFGAFCSEIKAAYGKQVMTIPMDVTDEASIQEVYKKVIHTWGGLDLLVINAGLAHVSSLKDMDVERFQLLEKVNIEGTLLPLKNLIPLFEAQKMGGDVVLVSTKNVFSPSASFGAYSATKAASHQLARIASLELAPMDVRVNMVAPDGVFADGDVKSGLWALVGPDRMKARGLDEKGLEEYYRGRNLLKTQVTASHVGKAVAYFATRQSPTTGATIPVDGGLPDATPR